MELSSEIAPLGETKERLFQCSTCKRSFTRIDHLMRHVRSHTKQRPYICPTCSKAFARVDLLKRHAANHSSDNGKKRARTKSVRPNRTVQACEECSKSHLRCEDEKPCSRCLDKNLTCRWAPVVEQDFEDTPQSEPREVVHAPDVFEPSHVDLTPMEHPQLLPFLTQPNETSFDEQSSIDTFMPDFLNHIPLLDLPFSGYATPQRPTSSAFNWDLDFSSLEYSLFESGAAPNFSAPHLEMEATDETVAQSTHEADAAIRAKAFDGSVWRYMPRSQTNPRATEEQNLAIADGDGDANSPSHVAPRMVTKQRLTYTSRDRLLALIIEVSNPINCKKIAAGFPSLDSVEAMVQIFFTSPSIRATSMFHLPTFSPNDIHPQLLACIVAAGASSVPDTLLQKLGLAMHETSRIAMANSIEEDNSVIRDIQYLYMQLLVVEIGMWSGISRKMEIAESFLQPPITMLRRGGRFGRSVWKKIIPKAEDNGSVLEEKWKEWILQESWIRLVFRYFELDQQSSMVLLKPPLISYAEMKLPLPHSDSLWHAPSAANWKATYFRDPTLSSRRPTLQDCMEDLDHLDNHSITNSAYLHVIWGMIWEYRQLKSLSARVSFTDDLLLSSRHAELTRLCEDYRLHCNGSNSQTEIVVEALLVHLNVSLDDIQTFAGIAGPDEAKHVYPLVRDWSSTSGARQAVYHAYNILQLSDEFVRGMLRNSYAMTVYHAALVMWVYGLLQRSVSANGSDTTSQLLILGNSDDKDIKRFIKLNRGEPAIRCRATGNVVPLNDAAGILTSVLYSLRRNHDTARGFCPYLVENLMQLMESLRLASK